MTSPERRDPYIVLGVPRQASAAEIARAYRRAARASHPDSGGAASAEQFRVVSDAYDELRDPRRRAMYDRSHPLARSPTAGTSVGSVRYECAPVTGSRNPVTTAVKQICVWEDAATTGYVFVFDPSQDTRSLVPSVHDAVVS